MDMFQHGFIFRKSRFYATHMKHIQTVFGKGNDEQFCVSIAKSNSGLKEGGSFPEYTLGNPPPSKFDK